MVKKQRAKQVIGSVRAIDKTRTRRGSQQAAGGADVSPPLTLDTEGRRTLALGGNFFVNGEKLDQRVGGGLMIGTSSPKMLTLDLDADGSISVNKGKVSATVKSSQVENDGEGGGTVLEELERLQLNKAGLVYVDAANVVQDGRLATLELFAGTYPATIGDYAAHMGGSGLEVWHYANCATNVASTTGTLVLNTLYAMPFIAPRRGGTLDRVGVNVTTGVLGNARMGIYANTSESNVYPAGLLIDAGTFTTTIAAVNTLTISQVLTPGQLYWLVIEADVAAIIRALSINQVSHLLGTGAAMGTNANCGISVAFTYAALPSTFPAGGAFFTGSPIPALAYRFAA